MSLTDEEGARLLAPLRTTEPAAGTGVDVSRAVRTGRRRRRGRTIATAIAGLVLIALPAVAVPLVIHDGANSLSPGSSGVTDPTLFDYATRAFTVGTAGGFEPDRYTLGQIEQSATLIRTDNMTGSGGEVTVYPPNRYIPGSFDTPADPVNGRRAYWQSGDNPTLAVELANDVWAVVRLQAEDYPDLTARVHRVAESITFQPVPLEVPFTVPTSLSGLPVTAFSMRTTPNGGEVAVILAFNSLYAGPQVTVTVHNTIAQGTPNDTIGGHPAIVQDATVILPDVSGFSVVVHSDTDLALFGIDRLRALTEAVRLVPDLQHRDSWPRHPMR
jgi:hypothetical protein